METEREREEVSGGNGGGGDGYSTLRVKSWNVAPAPVPFPETAIEDIFRSQDRWICATRLDALKAVGVTKITSGEFSARFETKLRRKENGMYSFEKGFSDDSVVKFSTDVPKVHFECKLNPVVLASNRR